MDEKRIDQTEEVIDLSRLLREMRFLLRRLFWIPLALMVLAAGLLFLRAWRSYTPMYSSEVTFTIQVTSSGESDLSGSYSYYDKTTAEQLGKTFPYLIQSDLMYTRLKEAMGVESINGTVTANTVPDTNLFTIKVTSSDPKDAKEILEQVIQVYPQVADYVIGNTTMNLLTQPQEAVKPDNQFSPLRTTCKGALLGLALGLVLLFLCAAARRTIREPEDVQTKLNQTCLAELPRVTFKRRKENTNQLVTVQNQRVSNAFQESVRSLRIKLLRQLPKQGCQTLLVTSTLPGEGKTTVSINLALSLSMNGARVILVDMDLRKPSVKQELGLTTPSKGVVELLEDADGNPQDYLTQVGDTSLFLLAGDTGSKEVRQMDAEKLSALLDGLREQADVILLDMPPCGLLADSVNVAQAVDHALYVVGCGIAEIPHIVESMQFLAESGTTLLGCVLNGVQSSHGGYGYGYGYQRAGRGKEKQKEGTDA